MNSQNGIDHEKYRKLSQFIIQQVEESDLASIKGTLTGVINIINDPNSNAHDLKELIQIDPPLSARVLRVANSPYYVSHRTISEIDQAVIWIGFDALKEIVLTQKFSEIFNGAEKMAGYSRELLWQHSLAVALLAKMIFRKEFGIKGNNAYAAGLMHDIGIIVEDQILHDDFKKIMLLAKNEGKTIIESELDILGFCHGEIGFSLTHYWNFPDELAQSIGFHHEPHEVDPEYARLTKTLYIADHLAFHNGLGYGKAPLSKDDLFHQFLSELNVSPYALETILSQMKEDLKKITDKGTFRS